jgi:hypothetical protein
MYPCVTTHADSTLTDLYIGSWSPAHDNICCFKVSVLVPPEWGHQMLSCFGFSPKTCALPCHVIWVQPHCCICPRSIVCMFIIIFTTIFSSSLKEPDFNSTSIWWCFCTFHGRPGWSWIKFLENIYITCYDNEINLSYKAYYSWLM